MDHSKINCEDEASQELEKEKEETHRLVLKNYVDIQAVKPSQIERREEKDKQNRPFLRFALHYRS